MTTLRDATPRELAVFAALCNCKQIVVEGDKVTVVNNGTQKWDPLHNDTQAFQLLEVVIRDQDCRLFYDHGVNEYFIYQYHDNTQPPVAHRQRLGAAVVEAALNLYFPDKE